jgi:serine protease inhibitor
MDTVFSGTVLAVNELTARWARVAAAPDANTALSAAGLWPLLAFLGGGAAGPARAELADALGVSADTAIARGRAVLEVLDAQDGLATALGVWTRDEVKPREEWLARLPPGSTGRLTGEPATDQAALDAWAARGTGGLIPAMPLTITAETLLVLASALSVQTAWEQPFTPCWMQPDAGPWRRGNLAGLCRSGADLDGVRLAMTPRGPLTVLEVRGAAGIDVHLLLGGPDQAPGAVIEAGTQALAGAYHTVPGSRLADGEPGPGVKVGEVLSRRGGTATLDVCTPAFTVGADHDLLARAELFGLVAAADSRGGHFPGISRVPLAVGQARQAVTASFRAEGFEAAAVTAFGMIAAASLGRPARTVSVDFERPFGFLAVHRATGLVLTAGWVAEPERAALGNDLPWPDEEEGER